MANLSVPKLEHLEISCTNRVGISSFLKTFNFPFLKKLSLNIPNLRFLPVGLAKCTELEELEIESLELGPMHSSHFTSMKIRTFVLTGSAINRINKHLFPNTLKNLCIKNSNMQSLYLGSLPLDTLMLENVNLTYISLSQFPTLTRLFMINCSQFQEFARPEMGSQNISSHTKSNPFFPATLRELVIDDLPSLVYCWIPITIGYCSQLKTLIWKNTHIQSLPSMISRLNAVEYISLHGNSITTLPNTLGFCNTLKHLDVSSNPIHSLPNSLGNLVDLISLNVSNTNIRSMPASFINCKSLTYLDFSRTRFNLFNSSSDISKLQAKDITVSTLVAIPNLRTINFSYTDLLDDLLPSQFHRFPNLEYLITEKVTKYHQQVKLSTPPSSSLKELAIEDKVPTSTPKTSDSDSKIYWSDNDRTEYLEPFGTKFGDFLKYCDSHCEDDTLLSKYTISRDMLKEISPATLGFNFDLGQPEYAGLLINAKSKPLAFLPPFSVPIVPDSSKLFTASSKRAIEWYFFEKDISIPPLLTPQVPLALEEVRSSSTGSESSRIFPYYQIPPHHLGNVSGGKLSDTSGAGYVYGDPNFHIQSQFQNRNATFNPQKTLGTLGGQDNSSPQHQGHQGHQNPMIPHRYPSPIPVMQQQFVHPMNIQYRPQGPYFVPMSPTMLFNNGHGHGHVHGQNPLHLFGNPVGPPANGQSQSQSQSRQLQPQFSFIPPTNSQPFQQYGPYPISNPPSQHFVPNIQSVQPAGSNMDMNANHFYPPATYFVQPFPQVSYPPNPTQVFPQQQYTLHHQSNQKTV